MAAGRMAAQSFMTSLPSKLGEEEEELIELLDRIGSVIAEFLPRSVTLQDWAELRVPASDVARVNASGLVHVGSKGTKAVTKSSAPVPPKGPPPLHIAGTYSGNLCRGLRRSHQHVVTGERPGAIGAAVNPESALPVPPKRRRFNEEVFDMQAFLQELPEGELSPQEAALRLEIMKHLFRASRHGALNNYRASRRGASSKQTDKPIMVARVAETPCVKGALESFLLPASHLEDWMRERVGNEFLVSGDEHGNAVVELEKSVKFPHRGTVEHDHISAEFFSSLPSEAFSPEETDLRDRICGFIDHFNGIPTLSTMCQDQQVGTAKRALLPHGVSMKEWIEERCAEDFDLVLNRSNQNCIGHAGTLDPEVVARMEHQPGSSRHNDQRRKGGKGAKR